MKNKKLALLLFVVLVCLQTARAQNNVQLSSSVQWKSDSTIFLQLNTTNFNAAFLLNTQLDVYLSGKRIQQKQLDSLYIGKGISISKETIELENRKLNPYADTLTFQLSHYSTKSKQLIGENSVTLKPRKNNWASLAFSDSSISLLSTAAKNLKIDIHTSHSGDSTFSIANLPSDTTILWYQIVHSSPFKNREIQLTQTARNGESKEQIFYYTNGTFVEGSLQSDSVSTLKKALKKDKVIQVNGNLGFESNFFSHTPQHSNGSQYPYTSFSASNQITVYGIPFIVDASHSANGNVSPNFRNFFSLRFDANSFRESAAQQLKNDQVSQIYHAKDLNADILNNESAIQQLEKAKSVLLQYPNEGKFVDSLFATEMNQLLLSEKKDSLFGLDSLGIQPPEYVSSNYPDSLQSLDSSLVSKQKQLFKIQQSIDRLKRSNELKQQYAGTLRSNSGKLSETTIHPNKLFSQFDPRSLTSLLLRFEKFEVGNFYHYAGQYSIRDIEMKGVSSSFLLNSENKINIIYGKVNDFQSFNLDNIEDSKKVSSVGFTNHHLEYFQPTVRLTQFKDETINPELSVINNEYYVFSASARGDVKSLLSYEFEINRSNENLQPLEQSATSFNKTSSYYFQSYFTPFSFLDFKLQYDQVGSAYQSDGVYFLNRNSQVYTVGTKVRLFKNKFHVKTDYSLISRNFEQKELVNETRKMFFDAGTHFKRIPNLSISYAPISVEVANKLDTSFSGIDANTNVLIARLFYFKKVKKTVISTALIYNEIENELADNFSTQKGIQHFAGLSNDKISFSFSSAYDKTFASVRFVSADYSQKINEKLSARLNVAKNFQNHFYSEIIRSEVSHQLFKQLNLGIGGIFLIEKQSGFVNTGGTVSLRFNY